VLPQILADALAEIDRKLEILMTDAAAEQAQLDTLSAGMTAVAAHVTSAAGAMQQFIADAQAAQAANQPLDFSGANAALASLQAADTTMQGILPQAPEAPLPTPVPDPGPPPTPDQMPADPTIPVDVGASPDSGSTPDVPPDAPLPT